MPNFFSSCFKPQESQTYSLGNLVAAGSKLKDAKAFNHFFLDLKACKSKRIDVQGALHRYGLSCSKNEYSFAKNENIKLLVDHLVALKSASVMPYDQDFKMKLKGVIGVLKSSHMRGMTTGQKDLADFMKVYKVDSSESRAVGLR